MNPFLFVSPVIAAAENASSLGIASLDALIVVVVVFAVLVVLSLIINLFFSGFGGKKKEKTEKKPAPVPAKPAAPAPAAPAKNMVSAQAQEDDGAIAAAIAAAVAMLAPAGVTYRVKKIIPAGSAPRRSAWATAAIHQNTAPF